MISVGKVNAQYLITQIIYTKKAKNNFFITALYKKSDGQTNLCKENTKTQMPCMAQIHKAFV